MDIDNFVPDPIGVFVAHYAHLYAQQTFSPSPPTANHDNLQQNVPAQYRPGKDIHAGPPLYVFIYWHFFWVHSTKG